MENKRVRTDREKDMADLILIRKMKEYADKGYNVELKKAPGGGYKILRVNKVQITAE